MWFRKVNSLNGDQEWMLRGYTIRDLVEWNPGEWRFSVSRPDGEMMPLSIYDRTQTARTIDAISRNDAIREIKRIIADLLQWESDRVEASLRRGRMEDIPL